MFCFDAYNTVSLTMTFKFLPSDLFSHILLGTEGILSISRHIFFSFKRIFLKQLSLIITLVPFVQFPLYLYFCCLLIVLIPFLFFSENVSKDSSLLYYQVVCSVQSPMSASCLIFNSQNMCFVHFNTTLSLFWSVCFSKWPALAETIILLVVIIT